MLGHKISRWEGACVVKRGTPVCRQLALAQDSNDVTSSFFVPQPVRRGASGHYGRILWAIPPRSPYPAIHSQMSPRKGCEIPHQCLRPQTQHRTTHEALIVGRALHLLDINIIVSVISLFVLGPFPQREVILQQLHDERGILVVRLVEFVQPVQCIVEVL